jgi:NAD(P)-dependent dehydrogenase (short-subunit alcohol dehydrogenase family)
MRLSGKVVVITGAGAGLGRTCSLLFAREGAKVFVADIDQERVDAVISDVREAGGEVAGLRVDVSNESQVSDLVAGAVEAYGRLDVMFNNAGIPIPGNGEIPFEELTDEIWQRVLSVNLSSVFYGCKHAVEPMRRNGGGSIINTSSGGAFGVVPGWAVYAATKGGVNVLTKGLAVDLGKYNIRVNAMCPVGGMSSNFLLPPGSPLKDNAVPKWDAAEFGYPLKVPRPPMLSDHAELALFLASDASAYMSGQLITVDGALLAQMPPVRRT